MRARGVRGVCEVRARSDQLGLQLDLLKVLGRARLGSALLFAEHPAEHAHQIRKHGQQRQRDDERKKLRQRQRLQRRHTQSAQRVDLLGQAEKIRQERLLDRARVQALEAGAAELAQDHRLGTHALHFGKALAK